MLKKYQLLKVLLPLCSILILLSFSGCNSLPGDGGTSTITGKVFVDHYNGSGFLYESYYSGEVRVYIIYGDGTTFDNETKTSFDGSFQFNFLREGTYTLFSYSDCVGCEGGIEAHTQTVEITKNHQEVSIPDILIDKR